MANEWDVLIHRHLDGSISDEESARLEAALSEDPELRRRMAEASFDHALIRRILARDQAAKTASAPRRMWPFAAAAMILVAVGAAFVIREIGRVDPPQESPLSPRIDPSPDPPSGTTAGFRGVVQGEIVAPKTEFGFSLRIRSIVRPAPDSGATAPGRLVGTVIRVTAASGRRRLESASARAEGPFIKKAQVGQVIEIDVRHKEKNDYGIGELTPAQIDWATQGVRSK